MLWGLGDFQLWVLFKFPRSNGFFLLGYGAETGGWGYFVQTARFVDHLLLLKGRCWHIL